MNKIDITSVPWNRHPENNHNTIPTSFDVGNELKFRIIGRIGSASLNGRVYEVEQTKTGSRVALKIMMVENIQECETAQLLGVFNPKYFPRVLSWEICPNVIVRKIGEVTSDTFIDSVETNHIKNHVISKMNTKLEEKRMRVRLSSINTMGIDLINDMKDIGVSHEILGSIDVSRGVKMLVMASELMSGDLKTFIDENKFHREIPRLIGEVFAGLRTMVRKKIVHEDLHLGNVLIRIDENNNLSSVLHDFGESLCDRSAYEHIKDIRTFLHALIHSPISNVLEEMIMSSNLIVENLSRKEENIKEEDVLDLLRTLENSFKSI